MSKLVVYSAIKAFVKNLRRHLSAPEVTSDVMPQADALAAARSVQYSLFQPPEKQAALMTTTYCTQTAPIPPFLV